MISLLSRLFIKNPSDLSNQAVRRAYGVLCSGVGIALNLLLCLLKLFASYLSGSVAIAADAFNNLSDTGSSLITLIGFRLAGQKPDPDHPFGHGRIEYISGFLVSLMIVMMGVELVKSSVQKIVSGADTAFSLLSVIILAVSIAVKLYMYLYNTRLGKKLSSSAMKATGVDCLSDCISTGAVLLCTLLTRALPFAIDGWCGLLVALLILISGFRTAKETLDPLLGTPPDKEFVERIHKIVLSYPEIQGIHDLIVHNYGPGRLILSLHAEVSQNVDILAAHDTIDRIEQRLAAELLCTATIHMDPIATDDVTTVETKRKVTELARAIHPEITLHDFRMVIGFTHTNLIFDLVLPYGIERSEQEVKAEMVRLIQIIDPSYEAVITVDRPYVN